MWERVRYDRLNLISGLLTKYKSVLTKPYHTFNTKDSDSLFSLIVINLFTNIYQYSPDDERDEIQKQ